ncbi:MAG: hypothetical protein HZA53_07065 [Planctomycetes bacterium]|nr:hypothetical protein [Planctomycetota bacterium]
MENREQLRWLEAGRRMRVLDAERVPEGIDTPDDYERFVARWTARGDRSTGGAGSRSGGAR